MSPWEWSCYVVLPILGIFGHYLGLWFAPDAYRRIFFSEQGLIELGTAAFYGVGACVAVTLSFKTRELVPKRYRVLYLLFALTALFVALEEISYGQHLFGWETPQWFSERNVQQEINLHNLFGSKPNRVLSDLAHFVFPVGFIVLPGLVVLRHGQYTPDHWAYYILPRGQLITVVILAGLLRVLRKLPSSALTGSNLGLTELMEFYWATVILLYVVVMWRRLISSDWKPLHELDCH